MQKEILHLVNLDTIGGVEELFVHFLHYAATQGNLKHHILVTGGPIHSHFKSRIDKYAARVSYEKYVCGIKIPKLFRNYKKQLAFKSSISQIILWNRFDDVSKLAGTAKVTYYEHGASWMHPKSDKDNPPEFLKRVDAILANSQAAKQIIELKWGIKKPISVIENPLRPDLAFAEHSRHSVHTPFRLGFIGRLIPLKGCALLLHAVSHLKKRGLDVELIVAGMGQEKENLMKEAEKLGIRPLTTFLGAVQNVTSFYDSIDLLVVPSIREPLGLVALEASARACPCVASYVDGLAEAVLDGKNGISLTPTLQCERSPEFGGSLAGLPDLVFDPQNKILVKPKLLDPECIANCIEGLILQPDAYRRLSQDALLFAKEYPNFSQYAEKLLTFIS